MRPDIFFHLVTYKVTHQQGFSVPNIPGNIHGTYHPYTSGGGVGEGYMRPENVENVTEDRQQTIERIHNNAQWYKRISRLSKGVIDRR
ncbi:hypothetical protein M422DRAFT_38017 [Sphaerobolus stellatus SS14]|uniref:Uncharacterized protein n=1 Tax=Sphaerobolus stellatus (strain SS14) TaxID=990650 RepID=A0A0C9UCV2_SPHS4|nr:hypothetical protein M422DRAFT_38017 [Sphaerobolus stellatus SS14]